MKLWSEGQQLRLNLMFNEVKNNVQIKYKTIKYDLTWSAAGLGVPHQYPLLQDAQPFLNFTENKVMILGL